MGSNTGFKMDQKHFPLDLSKMDDARFQTWNLRCPAAVQDLQQTSAENNNRKEKKNNTDRLSCVMLHCFPLIF